MASWSDSPANAAEDDDATRPWPSAVSAWWAVAVLTFTYLIAFVDRQILSLLVEPLKHSLHLTDTQISLLQGFAFGAFYTLVGVPIGRLIDASNRRNVVAMGCFLWCIATSLSGFAAGFAYLFLARMAVGIGEATVSPGALSILSDCFPARRRALPISIYIAGASVGAGAALLAGGSILQLVGVLATDLTPLIGPVDSWRLVFMVVGAVGLLAVALLLTVREPIRRGTAQLEKPPSWSEFRRFLKERAALFGPYFLGFALCSTVGYGVLAWAPTFLIRVHHLSAARVGFELGIVIALMGVCGVLSGGVVATQWRRRGAQDAAFRTATLGVAGMILPAALAPLVSNTELSIGLFGVTIFFLTFASGVSAAALQEVTPNRLRAQTSAIYFFAINFVGVGLGPLHIALITDYVFADEAQISTSLITSALCLGPLAALLMLRALRNYRRWQR